MSLGGGKNFNLCCAYFRDSVTISFLGFDIELHENQFYHSQRENIYNATHFIFPLCSKNQALELTWGHDSSVFLSWTPARSSSSQDSHQVELCRQLGERLGLKDGEQVRLHRERFV